MSRYQLHEEIGRGAMGVVYRATQLDLDRVVALKLLGLDGLDDRSAVERFHAEAQALAGFDHPHIVRVLDTGTHDGRPFMAMELLEGVDLQTLRDRRGAQPVEQVLSWLIQLCDALAAIHLWSARDGAISSQDIPELGLVAEHLSYKCKAKLPLRQVRQGERLLFEINCNGLGPTERLSFHFSRDGTSFSSPVFTITGQNDNTVRAYHHWIDPALVSEPVWLRVDYHHCESIKVTGSASFLWALFHYVKTPAL